MSHTLHQINRDFIDTYGPAPTTPAQSLAHVLAVHADAPDERMVLEASNNIYGDGVKTGLTLGDLRALAADLGL